MKSSSQEPLRGNKCGYYEGGIREPFIVRWPGIVKPGSSCDEPIINQDLYPTFLAAANAPVPAGAKLDGESLLPLFKQSGPLLRKGIFWHFPGYLDSPVNRGRDKVFRTRPVTVMRSAGWKVLLHHEEWQRDGGHKNITNNNSVELYNLKKDPGERDNLVLTELVMRDQILVRLLSWMKATGATMGTEENPDYDPDTSPRRQKKK